MKKPKIIDKIILSKAFVFFLGITATLWFLIRVLPKPSRAKYPCMQAAAPIMSSFVIYLLGVSASWLSFKKFKAAFQSSKYLVGLAFFMLSLLAFSFVLVNNPKETIADALTITDNTFPVESNKPIGEAKGLYPGRVVWVHNVNATNENFIPENGSDVWFFESFNTNENVIKSMMSESIMKYAEKTSSAEAWDAIFKAFNKSAGKGEVGYNASEKIAIKTNFTNSCCSPEEERMDGTPQAIKALLNELVNNAGVPQENITIGDPYRGFKKEYLDIIYNDYPDVVYVDGMGDERVMQTEPTEDAVLFFSDGMYESTLPKHYVDAAYFINMPCLKTHDEGGITLIGKNHQGSYLPVGNNPSGQSAFDMHYSLPKNSTGQGKFRHTVDYMGHEHTGGKALLYIVDGIWGGESWQGWIKKFVSDPFNNDYPNSLFISQDPIALESVCFDVLFQEYAEDSDKGNHPISLKEEVADYLSQAASSDYWPVDIQYDPEGDGSVIGSLGVFEHWNNAMNREYTRNLGTGEGIELIYHKSNSVDILNKKIIEVNSAYPNPFKESTTIEKPDDVSDDARVEIYNSIGALVQIIEFDKTIATWNGKGVNGACQENGIYIYNIIDHSNPYVYSGKVILNK